MSTGVRSFLKRILTLEVMLFFGLWLVYGMLISQKNIWMNGQSTTEAIVDYHRFSVENLTAWPVYYSGDVFDHEGHTYSNKDPGQAIITSVVYAQLKLLGISYAADKFFAGALVIFFTTSLFTAFAAVLLYRLARDLEGRRTTIWPLAAALVWGLCTTQMAMAGHLWHGPIAAPMLVVAVYLLYTIRNTALDPQFEKTLSVLAGFVLGMVVTTSMTFLFMVAVFGLYFLAMRRWRLLVPFLLAGTAGAAPVVFYNTINFGSPFNFPTFLYFKFATGPSDVYFFLDWNNFTNQALAYYDLVNWYVPVLWLGLAGLLFLPSKFRREQLFLFAAIAVLVLYMLNISGLGGCGYGPRYLLGIMPFCALGIVGLGRVPTKPLKLLIGAVVFWVAFESFRVNAVGAIDGGHCPIFSFNYQEYVERIFRGPLQFPLFNLLLPVFVLWCVWAVYSQVFFRARALPDGGGSF